MATHEVTCALIRGGTTKGVFIDGADLPDDSARRDKLLLALFGSPDVRQINGLGGGDPLSSKVAIVRRTPEDDVDMEYLSGEVGIDEGTINYTTLCGNLAAGAALYALEAGWVPRTEPVATVRLRNSNTGKRLTASIPLKAGACAMRLCKLIDGTAGYGTEMSLAFHDPAGAITGHLLPSGRTTDTFTLASHGEVRGSIVDCGTLYGFVPAEALGLRGDERPLELDADAGFKSAVESIREQIAFAVSANLGEAYCPQQVKVAIIGSVGVTADTMVKSVTSRVINRYKTHKAYPVSGAICLSAAGVIPGTVVHELLGQTDAPSTLHIVHPTGTMAVSTSFEIAHGQCKITQSVVNRSARVLMQGVAYAYVEDEMMDYRRLSGDERIISPASMQS